MEVDLEVGKQCIGRLDKALKIIPAPMAGELLFHIPPEALDEIEVRRVGGQKEGLEPGGVPSPHLGERMALVVANVVEDQHNWFVGGQRLGKVVVEGSERGFSFARADLPEDLARGVVDGAKDRALLILAGRRNPQWSPLALPDFCQVGVGVDFALVHVDQVKVLTAVQIGSSERSNRFFGSQSSTCLAAATAA
jgi:hypothetical protein